jgi:hypothetical protein
MGPQGPTGEAGAPGEPGESFAAGSVVLIQLPGTCPKGWSEGGQALFQMSPEYEATAGQTLTNPGMFTSFNAGWSNVNFGVCIKTAGQ